MYRLRPCRRIAADTQRAGEMQPWQLRRNVLRRDLRAAVRDLSALIEKRTAQRPSKMWRVRALSDHEAEAIVGADFLAQVAASTKRA